MANRRFLEQIARMYYILDLNQQQIAEQLGIGRSSVARFLNEARKKGVVHFQIDSDSDSYRCQPLERKLLKKTQLKDCVVFQSGQYPFSSMRRAVTSLIFFNWFSSGVLVDVVIFTTSFKSANSFFWMASLSRSWLL